MGLLHALLGRARTLVMSLIAPPPQSPRTVEQHIDQHLLQMDGTLASCRIKVVRLRREQIELSERARRHRELAQQRVTMARACAARTEVEDAREHLLVRDKHEGLAAQLEAQLAAFKQQSDALADAVRDLELEVEEARRKKSLLLTQETCAEARLKLAGQMPGGPATTPLVELLESLEDRVVHREVQALLEAAPGGTAPRL
jgi:phage shock protein A